MCKLKHLKCNANMILKEPQTGDDTEILDICFVKCNELSTF